MNPNLNNVHILQAQIPETDVEPIFDFLRAEIEAFRALQFVPSDFGGQIISLSRDALQRFADNLLGLSLAIPWRRVDVIDAAANGLANRLNGSHFVTLSAIEMLLKKALNN